MSEAQKPEHKIIAALRHVNVLIEAGRQIQAEQELDDVIDELRPTLLRLGYAIGAAAAVVSSAPRSVKRCAGEFGDAWDMLVQALEHVDMIDVGLANDAGVYEDENEDEPVKSEAQNVSVAQTFTAQGLPGSMLAMAVLIDRGISAAGDKDLLILWGQFLNKLSGV